MSDLDAGVLAEKLGIGPEHVEKALSEMGVPYSAPPAEPTESGFYVTADREWLLWLHSDGTGWGLTKVKGVSNNRTSWTDGALWLTTDWTLVVRTLGDGAFPLMTLEEALRAPAESPAASDDDAAVERAAVAMFRLDTDWASDDPTDAEVADRWGGQPDAIRDGYLRRARAALEAAR